MALWCGGRWEVRMVVEVGQREGKKGTDGKQFVKAKNLK